MTSMIFGMSINDLFAISAMINGVVSLVIGFIAFTSKDRTRSIYIFSLYMVAVSIWSIGYYFWMKSTNIESAHFWIGVLNVGSAFIPIAYFHWIAESFNRNYQKIFIIGYIVAFFCAALSFNELYFSGFNAIGGFSLWPIAGPFYSIYVILYLICSFFGIGIAVTELAKERRNKTNSSSAGYMLFVLILGLFATTNFPLWYGINIPPIGNLFIFLHVFALGYAMMRNNLMNLASVAPRLGISFILLGAVLNIFYSTTTQQYVLRILILIIVSFFSYIFIETYRGVERARKEVENLAKRLTESNWELARTNERLRVIDQRKSEFVSIVSHQLRTPITAIKGYSSMILEESYGAVPGSLKTPIEKIFLSSKRLAEMVNDFLDLSKIEQGKMAYNFTSVDIMKMLKDIEEEFTPIAKKKGLHLEFKLGDCKESCMVTADEGKIRQIFTNLIDNSIKYTPNGSVDIFLEKNDKEGKVIVRIKDTGIGLSQDDIHHLFGKFARGEGGQKQFTDGSGLGLYVAKKMIEAHHGKIWVDSPGIGKGSEFAVELLHEEHI